MPNDKPLDVRLLECFDGDQSMTTEGACHWCGREVVLCGPREADDAGSRFTNGDGETRFACNEHYPVMAAWVDEQVEREQKLQPTPL